MNIETDKIKKVSWQITVNRRESLFFQSITDECYKYFRDVADMPWKVDYIIRFSTGELFHSTDELNSLRALFTDGGLSAFLKFRLHLLHHVEALNKVAVQVEKTDCSKLKKSQLVKLAERYFQRALYAHNFLLPMPVGDGILSKMIVDALPAALPEEKQKWLGILTYPTKENEHTKEERSFYKLIPFYKRKDKNFEKKIQHHLRQFAWVGARGYWLERAWKTSDVIERLENFVSQHKDYRGELSNLDNIRKERAVATRDLLRDMGVKKSSLLFKLVSLAKEFAYLRTWRTDIIYGAGYKARNLFYEIADQAGFNRNDLSYLTYNEILKMAKTKKPPILDRELAKRKEYRINLLYKGQFAVLSGKEWKTKLGDIIQKPERVQEIRGNVAFQGIVRGAVKIVYSSNDLSKVKRGDVLVAVMTFPNYVPAMEKAISFVTDEGGILCHAAIVSREMKKPCIIGTKIATKVLKDGDLVEVDADKGIVKILKN